MHDCEFSKAVEKIMRQAKKGELSCAEAKFKLMELIEKSTTIGELDAAHKALESVKSEKI